MVTSSDTDGDSIGSPLDGVKVLAVEQMQSLPFATQLLARLGAEVVKVEHPVRGDLGRSSLPAVNDLSGNQIGATFLRNNLSKKSIGIDLKHESGQDLFRQLVPKFDVVAENFKAGTMETPSALTTLRSHRLMSRLFIYPSQVSVMIQIVLMWIGQHSPQSWKRCQASTHLIDPMERNSKSLLQERLVIQELDFSQLSLF